MLPVDQAAKTLQALAKALLDNKGRMTEQQRESLTSATYRTVMGHGLMPVNAVKVKRERKPERRATIG